MHGEKLKLAPSKRILLWKWPGHPSELVLVVRAGHFPVEFKPRGLLLHHQDSPPRSECPDCPTRNSADIEMGGSKKCVEQHPEQ